LRGWWAIGHWHARKAQHSGRAAQQEPGGAKWTINFEDLNTMGKAGITRELWSYLKERRKWWLLPIILIMLLVGALLVFAQGSVLAPFIYTIF
jgi:hypothetical protein